MKVGPAFKVSDAVFPSVKVSVRVSPDKVTLPLFSTVMVYTTISPRSLILLLLLSFTDAVLVASTIGFGLITSSVLSSVVLPSVSSPSSLRSVTPPGLPVLLAVTVTLLITPPASTTA